MHRHDIERASVCVEEERPALVPREVRRPQLLLRCSLAMVLCCPVACLGVDGSGCRRCTIACAGCWCRHVCCKCDGYGPVAMGTTDGKWRGTAIKNSSPVRPQVPSEYHQPPHATLMPPLYSAQMDIRHGDTIAVVLNREDLAPLTSSVDRHRIKVRGGGGLSESVAHDMRSGWL